MGMSAPVLVTGLPRSGTTWLAQQLTGVPGTALTGREPMNPHGRQFALQGTLTGWTRLDGGMTERQRRALRRSYRGWEPRVYSRYGVRRWAAPLPWVRTVVKDPFALLSLPAVTATTGARPIILFRHPAAVLASCRRMGWRLRPDIAEIRRLELDRPKGVPVPDPDDDLATMAWFWATCYATVLGDLPKLPTAVVVDHAELARGGTAALNAVAAAVGLPGVRPREKTKRQVPSIRHDGSKPRLHNLDRAPSTVADAWRDHVGTDEVTRIEAATSPVLERLTERSMRLPAATVAG